MDEIVELNVQNNRSSYWNSCVDFMETASLREQTMATGITGLVCFILLMFLLVFEIFYICRYKTTFLQRLFIHLTMVVTLVDAMNVMYLGYSAPLNEGSCYNLTLALGIIMSYVCTAEILTITFINITFLRTMFKYHFERRLLHSNVLSRYCSNRYCTAKLAEVIAVFTIFVGPLSLVVAGIFLPDMWIIFTGLLTDNYNSNFVAIYRVYGPGLCALLLSFISSLVMIIWSCSLKRKGLSKYQIQLVCRELSLVVGILATYSIIILLEVVLPLHPSLFYALFPIVHSCMPSFFFVYICTHTINDLRKKVQVSAETVPPPTVPPSTRVSLPTDTVAHALNFLSPSTAEPTEVTPLLIN